MYRQHNGDVTMTSLLVVSETIVGVNKYKLETETRIDVRAIDNTAVRKQQVARIQKMKDSRNSHQVGYTSIEYLEHVKINV